MQRRAAGLGQVTLRLEDLEAGGHACGELFLFGLQPALGQHARGAGRLDALGVGDELRRPESRTWVATFNSS